MTILTDWQPIETAPDGDGWVQVFAPNSEPEISTAKRWGQPGAMGWSNFYEYVQPTHWRPLPEPPQK